MAESATGTAHADGESTGKHTDHWARRLTDFDVPELPTRQAHQPIGDTECFRYGALPMDTAEALRRTSRRIQTAPAVIALATFALLLSRFRACPDVVISTPCVQRADPNPEAPLLPLPLHVDNERSLAELIAVVDTELTLAADYPDIDVDRLLGELDIASVHGANPLQRFVFRWEDDTVRASRATLLANSIPLDPAESRVPLELRIDHNGVDFSVMWQFDPAVIAPYALAELDRCYRMLLSTLGVVVDQQISDIEIPSGCPFTPSTVHDETLTTRWQETVRKYGDRPAVVGSLSLTYRELDDASDRIAAAVQARGARAGEFVGLAVPDGVWRISAILGIIKTGAAYVPLNRDWSQAQLAAVCADLGIRLAVTGDAGEWIEGVTSIAGDEGSQAPTPVVRNAASTAYINFSSGTTGEPKAILCTDAGVLRLVSGQDYTPLDDRTVMLQAAPVDFDAYTLELWGPLLNGGACVPVPGGQVTPETLRAAIIEHGVSTAWLTSALFNTLVDLDVDAFSGLRHLLVGGDVVSPIHVARAYRNHEALRIVNGYGPTENTTFTTYFPIPRDWPADQPTPIGYPIRGGEVRVQDERGRSLPPGFVGELVVSGAGLALGYLGEQERSGFGTVRVGERTIRVFRTGDFGYADASGCLHILGRRDSQVKINGRRVEPDGIDRILRAHHNVLDAATLPVPAAHGQALVSFVVLCDPEAEWETGLADWLRERLPAFQVPDRLIKLDALPMTANGKRDRRGLRRIAAQHPKTEATRALTPHERAVADVWTDVLGRAVDSPSAHFYRLGGNSLLCLEVQAALAERTGVLPDLTTVLTNPLLADLANALPGANSMQPLLRAGHPPALLPLTTEQQRLWFLHQMNPSSAYNIALLFHLDTTVEPARLEIALRELVHRHPVLRMVVTDVDGELKQHAIDSGTWAPRYLVTKDWKQAVANEADYHFELDTEMPLRALLLEDGSGSRALVLTVHHIAFDGHSLRPLLSDLTAHYQGDRLPIPGYSFADVALWQTTPAYRQHIDAALQYWTRRLRDAPKRTALPGTGVGTGLGTRRIVPGPQTSRLLEALARKLGVSPFACRLGVLGVLLARLIGEPDLLLATPVAHRERPEFRSVIGFLANTVPLRVTVDEEQSFSQLATSLFAQLTQDLAHQSCPLDELAAELGVRPEPGRPPLSEILFSAADYSAVNGNELRLRPNPVAPGSPKYPLAIAVAETDEGLSWIIDYDRAFFGESEMDAFADTLVRVLDQVAAEPDRAIEQIVLTVPDTTALSIVDPFVPITQHIARVATNQPITLAIHGPDLDHATVWRDARRYAAALAKHGLIPGDRVGVLLRRSDRLPVALLGILVLGATYVPLDPAYPAERLRYILADSAPRLVLTDVPDVAEQLGGDTTIIELDSLTGTEQAEVFPVGPDDLAYVIYTSGSTGKPKGVAIRHESLHWLRHWAAHTYQAEDLRQVLAGTSVCFDLSIFEIFVTWSLGGGLRVVENALSLIEDPLDGITLINTVPSVLEEVLEDTELPTSVRVVNLAGEPLRRSLVNRIATVAPNVRLYNLYGPSEDTTYSTGTSIPLREGPIGIGTPLAGTAAYVLDERRRPVPDGFPGELYLAGRGLAAGYLNRPDLTAERFVPDPFGGGRMYRTGDKVRRGPGGELEYLGRLDHQCKLRGFRVEPLEIDRVLDVHPGIREACVVPRFLGTPEAQLVAFVCREDPTLTAPELTAWTAKSLPRYMVPATVVFLDKLPLTPSGKVDRLELQARTLPTAEEADTPSGDTEIWLVERLAALLSGPRSSVSAHFAARLSDVVVDRLAVQVWRDFGVHLSFRDLVDHPTVRLLAALIDERSGESAPDAATLLI